jgi:hypothetical protein
MIRFVFGAQRRALPSAHADTLTLTDALQRVAQSHPLARAVALELEATRWRGRAEAAFAPMSVYLAPMIFGRRLWRGVDCATAAGVERRSTRPRRAQPRTLPAPPCRDAKRAQRVADPDCRSVRRRLRLPAPLGSRRAVRRDARRAAAACRRSRAARGSPDTGDRTPPGAPPRTLSAERAVAATAGRAARAAASAGDARRARCGRRRRCGRRAVSPAPGGAAPDAGAAAARCRAAGARGEVRRQLDAPCLRAGAGVPTD